MISDAEARELRRRELKFRGEADLATLRELIRAVDRSSAITWTGNGGVKERILKLIEDQSTRGTESTES